MLQKAIPGIRRRRAKREIAYALIDRTSSGVLGRRSEEVREEEAGDTEEEREREREDSLVGSCYTQCREAFLPLSQWSYVRESTNESTTKQSHTRRTHRCRLFRRGDASAL